MATSGTAPQADSTTFLPSMENLGAAGVGEVCLIILLAALTSHRCDVVHVGLAVSR
jgi:hypothetical protein